MRMIGEVKLPVWVDRFPPGNRRSADGLRYDEMESEE
jgi:hypothetical protein